jgi:hypothetical protein
MLHRSPLMEAQCFSNFFCYLPPDTVALSNPLKHILKEIHTIKKGIHTAVHFIENFALE